MPKLVLSGMKLKNYRRKYSLSQRDLARILGVTQGTISHYETGRTGKDQRLIKNIAEVLGVPIERIAEERIDWESD